MAIHSPDSILGLDIGGANLKAAHASGRAATVAFPLWKHPESLSDELQRLAARMPAFDLVVITMTGELCDCFATKSAGVRHILQHAQRAFDGKPMKVWTTQGRFVDLEAAATDPLPAAAANWLALAHWVARQFPSESALLIDTGSTTTDIVVLDHGIPKPRGLTDRERMRTGELVYTGVRRTPICSVLGMEVAAEFFATMLDAYLYLGLIDENQSDRDTADGRPATIAGAHARLARMVCADADSFSVEDARILAAKAMNTQGRTVHAAVERVLHGRPRIERLVVAGSGDIVGRLEHANHPGALLTRLADWLGPELSSAACAYAVAMLAREVSRHA